MQAQEIREQATPAITEQDRQIMEDFAKLEDAEKVLMFEVMKVLAAGDSLDSMLIHQPHEYKKILDNTETGQLFDAVPLMKYVLAKYDWGDMAVSMAFAYRVGIADGKRLARVRRSAGKKVPA